MASFGLTSVTNDFRVGYFLYNYYSTLICCSGYKEFKGQVLNSSDLASLVGGLRSNNLLRYSHMLTGKSSMISNICLGGGR